MSAKYTSLERYWFPFRSGMHFFGERIGAIVNAGLLLFVYGCGIGIPSLIARLFGKRFLEMKIEGQLTTYWRPIREVPGPLRRYLRQF